MTPSDPHHEIGVKDGGVKAGDDRVCPLCREHHRRLHESTGAARDYWIGSQAGWIKQTQARAEKEGVEI